MNTVSKELPQAVEKALQHSLEVSIWIRAHHPEHVSGMRRHLLAASYYAICMDHREAVLLLVDHRFRSAAFALWRSIYEALVRGLWAEQCATEQDFERIAQAHALPTFDTMVRRLDALEPGTGDSSYSMVKLKVWKKMSQFAHGELHQLARWAGKDGIGSRHPDVEVVELLQQLDIYGLLACMGVARLAELDTDQHQAKVLTILERM